MYKNIPLSINNTNTNTNIGFNIRRKAQTQPQPQPQATTVLHITNASVKIIDLFATRYIENIATALAKLLKGCGIEVFLHIRQLTNTDIHICQTNPGRFLFICCPQTFLQAKNGPVYPTSLLPLPANKYFLYQLEQLDTGSHTFMNANIIHLLKNAKHTFDYSRTNLQYYPADFQWKVSYLLPPVVEYISANPLEEKSYDIFFCGYNNPRREKIITDLREAGYKVLHTTNVFGPALSQLINQSKIFLNLHNNETSKVLETCRLNEAVMAKTTHILSEKGDNDNLYADRVYFIKDTEDLIRTVKNLLENANTLVKPLDKESWHTLVKSQLGYLYKDPLLVICNNWGGGSFKFITDISICYKVPLSFIKSKKELLTSNINCGTILILQSFLFTDLDVAILIAMYRQTHCKIILPIHDWYWFIYPYLNRYDNLNHNLYLSDFSVPIKTLDLFAICDTIICPSKFVYDIIHNKLPTFTNIFMQEWLDYDYKAYVSEESNVPTTNLLNKKIHMNKINIGVFHTYITYKGRDVIEYLVQAYPDVNFYIVGKTIPMYKETEFFTYIEKYSIHGLLYLNKWGETYCYSLTKALMSGLPILYNNFGAFKERIPPMERYIVNCIEESDYENKALLSIGFKKLLEYIHIHQGTYIKKTHKQYDFNLNTNPLFDKIFK